MVRTGQAVKGKTHAPKIVVIKPKKGRVYRIICSDKKDAELCVFMHEKNGDYACIL